MSRKEKLIKKLLSEPKDFTWDETVTLMSYFGYKESNKGKTSGSRAVFVQAGYESIFIHKPHPGNLLKEYQVKDLIKKLGKAGFL